MSQFYSLKVKELHKETPECTVISFDIPNTLSDLFQFRQGQHLTLRKVINGEDVRRNYSLCSDPSEGEWKVAVKQIFEGKFSTFVNTKLKVGDTIEVMPPSGEFGVSCDATKPKNYIAFAAGSGITPVLSMIKAHLRQEPKSTFKLFYLNRTSKSIIFKEEIEQLKNKYFNRFHVFYFLTQEKRDIPFLNGRFDHEKMELLTKTFIDVEDTAHCFICGPEEMIFLIRDHIHKAGLAKEKIHYELFVTGLTEADKERAQKALESKVEGTQVTIIDGGKEFHFTMSEEYDNLLDGALAAGADLPFACKGGVCSTCKCEIKKGTVAMKVNYALDEKEVAQNLILSCQAVPTSDAVVLDFDV